MNTSLAPENIEKITGILNGTTNYMLTKMSKEGSSYEDVLKEAQALGYAELNPEADVEGFDACRKIAILASLMTGKTVNFEEIYTEGITKITSKDFEYAKKMGKAIKLLAIAENKDGELTAMVAPCMIGDEHPLYNVNGVFNGIFVTGNMVDDLMFYGSGAGKLPTASAVVSDAIECARNLGRTLDCVWKDEKMTLSDRKDKEREFFVRVDAAQKDNALSLFEGSDGVSLDDNEFAFITPKMSERAFDDKIVRLDKVKSVIRVEA